MAPFFKGSGRHSSQLRSFFPATERFPHTKHHSSPTSREHAIKSSQRLKSNDLWYKLIPRSQRQISCKLVQRPRHPILHPGHIFNPATIRLGPPQVILVLALYFHSLPGTNGVLPVPEASPAHQGGSSKLPSASSPSCRLQPARLLYQ